jgi:glyoxylate/hydroxypyruvate reductase A
MICTYNDVQQWLAAFKAHGPALDVLVWPDDVDKTEVDFVLCWKHPHGALSHYPNLRCISSMGAGIDHLLADPFFPKNVPVVRLIDPNLATAMFDYVNAAVMYYLREFDVYQTQQRQGLWQQCTPKSPADTTIGVMGLGQLGSYVGNQFAERGFNVLGWSRSTKSIDGIKTFTGDAQLAAFLRQSQMLICLLPLTPQTKGILNLKLFEQLPKGACLVNVARGEHLVEPDLLQALDSKQLRGACLDVFCQEPLPGDHPFWQRPEVMITPHCSSITLPSSVVPQIVENYDLAKCSEQLLNKVHFERGY